MDVRGGEHARKGTRSPPWFVMAILERGGRQSVVVRLGGQMAGGVLVRSVESKGS